MRTSGQDQPGLLVVHILFQADLDPADSVDDPLESAEVHHHEVVDVQAGERANRLERACWATDVHRRVESCELPADGLAVDLAGR